MDIELTIKNYRCFSDAKPARIIIKQGYTAFIGTNNSGKSSILKFFYEFRDLFQRLSSTAIVNSFNGNKQGFNFPPEIMDQEEVFCNLNNRDLTIQIQLMSTDGAEKVAPPVLSKLAVIVPRVSNQWTCKMYLDNREVPAGNFSWKDNHHLYREDEMVADLSQMFQACGLLGNMAYIPSFRHGSKPCDTFEQSGSESSIAQSSQPMVSGRGRFRPL
jgi:hypothetical protein